MLESPQEKGTHGAYPPVLSRRPTMKKLTLGLFSALFSLLIAACSGGGSSATSVVPQLPVATPSPVRTADVTLRPLGGDVEANAGEWVHVVRVQVECPVQGALCKTPVTITSLKVDSSAIKATSTMVQFNGQWHNGTIELTTLGSIFTPIDPFVLREPGYFDVYLGVSPVAVSGQSSLISVSVNTFGTGVVEVVGQPTKLNVVVSAATISNVSSATFSKVGYGEMAGFDLACSADSGGCKIGRLRELLSGSNIPVGVDVDTFVGSVWWYGLQTTTPNANGFQVFELTSTTTIPAGTTVRISARSKLTAGKFEFDSLELTAVKNGKPIYLAGPTCKDSVITNCKG